MIANPKGCTGLEDIAALAEGRLSGAERERVVGHVAGCEECREVLAGVIAGMEEWRRGGVAALPEAGRLEQPAESPRRRRPIPRSLITALAAGFAVIVAGVVHQRSAAPEPPNRREWLASMPPAEQLVPHLWGGVTMRGGDSVDDLSRQSAELGALLVDLDVVTAAADASLASDLLRRMAVVMDQAGLLENEVALLRSTTADRDPTSLAQTLDKTMPAVEERLRQRFLSSHLDLGGFLETARLAALSQRREFLGSQGSRRYLDWVRRTMEPELAPQIRQDLSTLRESSSSDAEQAEAATRALRSLTQ
jgi:hypothetical protein